MGGKKSPHEQTDNVYYMCIIIHEYSILLLVYYIDILQDPVVFVKYLNHLFSFKGFHLKAFKKFKNNMFIYIEIFL